ncbi:MAG: hypothetical protein NVSMB22_07150 [Chloroflexota bacterium]
MLFRAILLSLILVIPLRAEAAHYVVGTGDSLGAIAGRYHISVQTLARLNHIRDINLVRLGTVLSIPSHPRRVFYRVRWGDSLIAIAARYKLSIAAIRAMNPSLGPYPLAGEWLRLCGGCGATGTTVAHADTVAAATYGTPYLVRPGDTLLGIASRFGTTSETLALANRLASANHIVIGMRLTIPRPATPAYNPWLARSLIVQYARLYGVNPALPLAVGWQESGFNQTLVSPTGAIGVMQVEPYTGTHIARRLGRSFNLHNLDDNIHAGVYWLTELIAYYGGDERLATAAYYEGSDNLARRGFFDDTVQYVNNVLTLKSQFGG